MRGIPLTVSAKKALRVRSGNAQSMRSVMASSTDTGALNMLIKAYKLNGSSLEDLLNKMTDTKGSSESIKEWKDYVRAHWDYVQLRPRWLFSRFPCSPFARQSGICRVFLCLQGLNSSPLRFGYVTNLPGRQGVFRGNSRSIPKAMPGLCSRVISPEEKRSPRHEGAGLKI